MKRLARTFLLLAVVVSLFVAITAVTVSADPIRVGGGPRLTSSSPIHVGGGFTTLSSPIRVGGG